MLLLLHNPPESLLNLPLPTQICPVFYLGTQNCKGVGMGAAGGRGHHPPPPKKRRKKVLYIYKEHINWGPRHSTGARMRGAVGTQNFSIIKFTDVVLPNYYF